MDELGSGSVELIAPSLSIVAEPPVTVVDKVVDRRGTREVATAYLQYLYSEEGQQIAAKQHYRPGLQSVARKYESKFPKVELFTIDKVFGGWEKAQKIHFADGGVFDQIYRPGR
jgi:sulfate transport system substrate-binding protein